MLDVNIATDDFKKACSQLSRKRTKAEGDMVDVTASASEVSFVVTGRQFSCPAAVDVQGIERIPADLLPKLQKVAETYRESDIRLRIEPGRVRINSMSINFLPTAPKPMSRRIIDIPDDALPIDILALPLIFTPSEIDDSNLSLRLLAANSLRLKELQAAGDRLVPLGIDAHMLDELHKEVIRQHADKLRPILLPDLMSDLL